MNERKLFTYGRFFVDDIEIYDFVTERAKKKIVGVFGSIFYIHSVVVSISTESYCHIWREDIVVPYVTTYAVTLRLCLRMYVMGKRFGVGNIWR